MKSICKTLLLATAILSPILSPITHAAEQETLPALIEGRAPQNYEQLWKGFDPQKEPLDVEVLKEWEQDGVVLKVIRYRIGIFKGKKSMISHTRCGSLNARNQVQTKLPNLWRVANGCPPQVAMQFIPKSMEQQRTHQQTFDRLPKYATSE